MGGAGAFPSWQDHNHIRSAHPCTLPSNIYQLVLEWQSYAQPAVPAEHVHDNIRCVNPYTLLSNIY